MEEIRQKMAPPTGMVWLDLNLLFYIQHCEVSVFSFYLEATMYGIFVLFGFHCLLQAFCELCMASSPGHCFKVSGGPCCLWV